MGLVSQDNIYYPLKFLADLKNLTDSEAIAKITSDLDGNSFLNGFIGILMKYRDPNFDTTLYQSDMSVIINHYIEFLILRFKKNLDFVSTVKFFRKVLLLTNFKYLFTVVDYLVSQNIISKTDKDYDVVPTENSYFSLSYIQVPSESIVINTNLIPLIQSLVYTSDSKEYFLSILVTNTTLNPITITTFTVGNFLLFPQQQYLLQEGESEFSLDTVCSIMLSFYESDSTNFSYKTAILTALDV